MLQERQKQLLLLLLENRDRFLSSQELAERLVCSDRTVQNDMHDLKKNFSGSGLDFQSQAGQGYRILIAKDLSLEVLNEILEWIHHTDEESEDIAFFSAYLLLSQDFITRDEIIEKLYISEEKLDNLVLLSQEDLRQSKLKLEAISGQGFQIKGPALFKRYALLYYYLQVSAEQRQVLDNFLASYRHIYDQRYKKSVQSILKEEGLKFKSSQEEKLHSYLQISLCLKEELRSEDQIYYYLYDPCVKQAAKQISELIFAAQPQETHYLLMSLSLMRKKSRQKISPNHLITCRLQKHVERFLNKTALFFTDHEALKSDLFDLSLDIYAQNILAYRQEAKDYLYQNKDKEYLLSERLASHYALSLEKAGISHFYAEDIALLSRVFNLYLKENLFKQELKVHIVYKEKVINAHYLARKLQENTEINLRLIDKSKDDKKKEEPDYYIYEEEGLLYDKRALYFKSFLQFRSIQNILNLKYEEKVKKKSLLRYFKNENIFFDLEAKSWYNVMKDFMEIDQDTMERRLSLWHRSFKHYEITQTEGIHFLYVEDLRIMRPKALLLHQEEGISCANEKLYVLFLFRIPDLSWLKDLVSLEFHVLENKERKQAFIRAQSFNVFKENLEKIIDHHDK